jgi:Ca2+-binding RTX toxin-like protein
VGALYTNNVSITTSSGNDVVTATGYTGALTVDNSGNGTLALTLGTGTTNLTGGTTVETVNTTADALTTADTLTGGNSTDIINITAAGTLVDADFTNVATFESITADDVALNITLGAEAKAGGITSVTFGNAANVINASAYTTTALTITGGTGADTIQGGTGADILSGGNGADVYKFNSTGALNGTDVITFVVADDKFDFTNMGTFTFNTVTAAIGGSNDVLLDNKITLHVNNGASTNSDEVAEIAALIQGNGDAMHLSSGAKGIVISGSDADAADTAYIFLVDDSVGATAGTIQADDVVLIGTLATFQLDTITTANFI